MKRRTSALIALVTMTSALGVELAHAQADAPLRLSLEAALARASDEAPEVVSAKAAVRTAQARRVGAGIVLPINPRVSADWLDEHVQALRDKVGSEATITTFPGLGYSLE